MANNYVVGRGKVFFDKFDAVGVKSGERYLGNTPALSMTSGYQNLDHYSSDQGLREKDDSVTLQVDRNGSFTCDNVSMENVALMFGRGDPTTEAVASSTGVAETFIVTLDRFYQLGAPIAPDGVGNVSAVVVTDNSGLHAFGSVTFNANPVAADTITVNGHVITFRAGAPGLHEIQIGATTVVTAQRFATEINAYPALYDVAASGIENVITLRAIASGVGGNAIGLVASGADPDVSGATLTGGSASGVVAADGNYTVDLVQGRLHILENAVDIGDGDTIEVVYNVGVASRPTVIDDESQVEGSLRFIADNPKGKNKNYFWPRVKITPSGEYALKSETWQTMTFNFEVLTPTDGTTNRVYVREAA